MRGQVNVVCLAAAVCLTLTATGLRADEQCYKGYSHPTQEEEATMQAVLDGALRALPSQLAGWESSTDDGLHVDPQCMDDDPRPWSYEFSRRFERVDDLAEREKISGQAGAEYQAARQANQPRMDAIMARIQELSKAAVAAAEAADYAKVDAINVEIENASAEVEELMSGGGALANLEAANEEVSRDRSIRIAVAVNPRWEPLGYEFRAVTAPAGASHAFRWQDTGIGPRDETELVLFGSWKTAGESVDQVVRPGVAQTVPQGILISVTADESRIESVLAGIDFAALANLVQR